MERIDGRVVRQAKRSLGHYVADLVNGARSEKRLAALVGVGVTDDTIGSRNPALCRVFGALSSVFCRALDKIILSVTIMFTESRTLV